MSTANLEQQLGVSHYKSSRILQELEDEGIVTPIKYERSRDMLIAQEYRDVSDFLFLYDLRTPQAGTNLRRDVRG